jgi:hypothetical protein
MAQISIKITPVPCITGADLVRPKARGTGEVPRHGHCSRGNEHAPAHYVRAWLPTYQSAERN